MFGLFSKEKKVVVNPWRSDPRISVYLALFGTPELRWALERKKGNSSDCDLQRVFDILQRGQGLYFEHECEQHDAAEYVEQLVKGLSADVSQPLCGTLLCSEGHVIEEMSPFWTLPLPFSATVEKGLQQMFDCNDTCAQGKNAALKDKKKSPPLVLVLHLKRFDLSQSKLAHVKSDCEVELTETIHTQGHSYSLCAVVDHWNSVREGHYTATIFADGKWFKFGQGRDQVEAPIGKKSSTAVLIIYRQNEEMSEFYRTDRDQQRWTESFPYHGLMNQGSTCYLNSVLQVLFMTPEFCKALEQPSNQTDRVLKRLFDKLQKGACGTKSVTKDLQAPNVQRCAAEYLEILMNRVSAEVSEPFHGEFLDITLCSEGHCINEEPTKFWTLPLSMEHISLVSEGFEKFFEKKKLKGIYCNKCEKTREATSRYEMTRPPQILVLLLKTFDIDPRSGYNYKSQCAVEIPGTLPTEGLMYSLCGVVDHSGGLGGGHYTATIQSQKDGHWYRFNDSHVRKVRVPNNRSSTAYLLIYRASEQVTEEKVDSGKKTSGKGRGQQKMENTVLSTPDHGEDVMNRETPGCCEKGLM